MTRTRTKRRRRPLSDAQAAAFHGPIHANGKQTSTQARHGIPPPSSAESWWLAPMSRDEFMTTASGKAPTAERPHGVTLNDRGVLRPD